MSEAFFTLGGVAVGGLITMAISFLSQSHEERMAQKNFERQETARLNEEVTTALAEQLEVGTKLATFVGRAKVLFRHASTREERTKALENAMTFVGIDPNGLAPTGQIKPPEFYEDDSLRALVGEHASLVEKAIEYLLLGDYEPERIPGADLDFFNRMADLKTKIEIESRQLRRAGRPL